MSFCCILSIFIRNGSYDSRLVLATTCPAKAVPPGIAACVNVVEFSQSRTGLEEMFLDRFLRLEKARMQDTRQQVVNVSTGILPTCGMFPLLNVQDRGLCRLQREVLCTVYVCSESIDRNQCTLWCAVIQGFKKFWCILCVCFLCPNAGLNTWISVNLGLFSSYTEYVVEANRVRMVRLFCQLKTQFPSCVASLHARVLTSPSLLGVMCINKRLID